MIEKYLKLIRHISNQSHLFNAIASVEASDKTQAAAILNTPIRKQETNLSLVELKRDLSWEPSNMHYEDEQGLTKE